MKLKDLVGYQLVEINNYGIVVKKDNKTFNLKIDQWDGDCCGFNVLKITSDFENNPVITNVQYIDKEIPPYKYYYEGESASITFYGEDKELAKLESYSSSGSGWNYGATVEVVCKELDIKEVLTSW